MINYCDYFRGKKITVMGLGVLGRGVNVAKFLAECGADLIITDLKNEEQLKSSLIKLAKFKNIRYVLGRHELSDFRNKDIIIKAASVPLNSPYIEGAKKNGAKIEMDASLFCKLAEGVITVGITGTKGKSTVSRLIFEILKSTENILAKKRNVFFGGNIKGQATLPLLKKARSGDIVVLELDSWQLQGFNDAKLSPHISVFTSFMPDHLNYYNNDIKQYFYDKAGIFKYQKEGDFLILGEQFLNGVKKLGLYDSLENFKKEVKSEVILTSKKSVPKNWKIKILGAHNLENIAAAIAVRRALKVKEIIIKKTVENFRGLPGRLEFIKEVKGVKFYNDTTATTPDAVISAIETFHNYKGKIILIGGGADKELNYKKYARTVKKFIKAIILFKGEASDKIIQETRHKKQDTRNKFKLFSGIESMKEAMNLAFANTKKGDIVLLSPGAASFGVFKNEFDRGAQFVKFVKLM